MTHVKICCIQSREEIDLAERYGASAVGLVSSMPSGPGVLDDGEIADLLPHVPVSVASFLLTAETDPDRIVDQAERFEPDVLQLVDRVSLDTYHRLRSRLPRLGIVQVIHVTGGGSLRRAVQVATEVDMLLLDSGRPDAAVKELGGTGRTHDWAVSRKIRERVDVPVWLAGGLRPDNVTAAVRTVQPYGVDVCSGLRANGSLQEESLARFAAAVRGA